MEIATVPDAATLEFLETIHAFSEGHIEFRLVTDRTTGEQRTAKDLKGRHWYKSTEDLAPKLQAIKGWSKANRCAVFFGVLPRRDKGLSKAADTVPAAVLWADLDWKDYPAGEADGRERIAAIQWQPSIIVRSAHGVHLYWLLSEPQEPDALSAMARRIGKVLGADACHDAARLLRLPGSWNLKDPANPVLVEIEAIHPDRRYHFEELDEGLPDLVESHSLGHGMPIDAPESLTPMAAQIINSNQRVRAHWEGRGKSADGDQSSSGYDWTVAYDILARGGNAEDAASAVLSRPDGAAKAKDRRHLERTIGRAKEAVRKQSVVHQATKEAAIKLKMDNQLADSWKPDKVSIYRTDPPRYLMTTGDTHFEVSTGIIASRNRMRCRLIDVLQTVPILPGIKGGAYDAWLNQVLAMAEVHEQPPEASRWGGLDEEIRDALETKGKGDTLDDFERGYLIPHGDRVALKLKPLLTELRHDTPDITRPELAQHLNHLGWSALQICIEGKQKRAWVSPDNHDPEAALAEVGEGSEPWSESSDSS